MTTTADSLYVIHTAVGNFIYIHSPRTAWICGGRTAVTLKSLGSSLAGSWIGLQVCLARGQLIEFFRYVYARR